MRLHQPTGTFLLLWPCLISLSMASKGEPDLALTIIFIIGSILMRSAGCIFNDIVDYKFDGKVDRTKDRPLANKKISRKNAIKLLILLLFIASLLLFFLNRLAVLISLASVPLIALYPFCKRFTHWPQLCLGLTFNLGALVAWAAVIPKISASPIILYIAFIFWTLGYDTIYAHQDKEDDTKLGLKSTAIYLGEKTEKYVNFFYTITATLIVFAFSTIGPSLHFYAFATLPVIVLFWQVKTLDIDDRDNCARRFKSNVLVGALFFVASIAAKV